MALWTFKEIATALKVEPLLAEDIHGISIDSRQVSPGDLFIAIDGAQNDGHQYVEMAFKKGAVGAIVHKKLPNMDQKRLFMVEDTQKALYQLADAARLRMMGKVIAITGSVGKTGLKECLAHILKGQGKIHYTQGNLNNHFGLPLTLCRMPKDTDYGIFEIGMNHAGEITPLVQLLNPHIAAITAIAEAHAEFFDGARDIAKAKAEIFLGFEGEGRVLLPGDDEQADYLTQCAIDADVSTIATFGTTTNRNYCARNIKIDLQGSQFDVVMSYEGLSHNFKAHTQTWGRHYVLTAIAALGLVHLAEGDVEKAVERLAAFTNPKGRGAILQTQLQGKPLTLIDDAYNANESSMKAALSLFENSEIPQSTRYAILGEMLELGIKSADAHLALRESILKANLNHLWLVGTDIYPLYQVLKNDMDVTYKENIKDILPHITETLPANAWLLVKGSHGSHVYKLVEEINKNQ